MAHLPCQQEVFVTRCDTATENIGRRILHFLAFGGCIFMIGAVTGIEVAIRTEQDQVGVRVLSKGSCGGQRKSSNAACRFCHRTGDLEQPEAEG